MDLKKLKELRKAKGMTQIQVAQAVGVSLMAYRLWEMGGNEPNRKNYKKLMEALEVMPFAEDEK